MISKYICEQRRYSQRELCSVFECSEERVIPLVRKLKEYGILKAVRSSDSQKDLSDLNEVDVEIADVELGENGFYYVFTFVGIITISGCVLKCYPKYIKSKSEEVQKITLHQIIKVLEKYNSQEQIVRMYNESSESSSFNLLAVMLFLLTDYFENGAYTDTEEVTISNGSGEILWEKTINETFTFIFDNKPYYIDLQTRKRINDDYDYFKRLHECLLTCISNELKEADLLDLFELTEVDLSDEELSDFGDKEYILDQIEKELNIQFNTRKQLILKTIYAYISNNGKLYDLDCLSLFGTSSFNIVWEKICADVLRNQLDTLITDLPISLDPAFQYDSHMKLMDLIEKPLWTYTGMHALDTLIPDIITIDKHNQGGYGFYILDAKYYAPILEPNILPKSQPGIESVTKQYLYQLAYKDFIEKNHFSKIVNCFILPTESQNIISKGAVEMDMFKKLGLQKIEVRFIPAAQVYSAYLNGTKIEMSTLLL